MPNSSHSMDRWFICVVVCLVVAAAATMIHVKSVDLPNREFQVKWHASVIEGHAPAPDQYRVLTFWAAEGIRRATGADLIVIYALLRLALTAAALVALYGYLRYWFSPSLSSMGVLLVGAALPVTFFGYKMQVTDPAQFLFFALAFRALQTNSLRTLYLIAPIAAANRETALFMIPFSIAVWWGTVPMMTIIKRSMGLGAAMLIVLAPIHLYYGNHDPYTPVFTLMLNLTRPGTLLYPGLLFGWLWFAAFTNLRSKPEFLRRLLLPAGLFFIAHFMVAQLEEVRLLLPLAPVILPLALFSMGDKQVDYALSTAK